MAIKFRDLRENNEIKPIERRSTSYTPMISRKSSLYRKDAALSSAKSAIQPVKSKSNR